MAYPIDAVILWVDGNDKALNEKRRRYAPEYLFRHDDSAGATRFASIGEIYWCVTSINRFAPWINRIFIVTDGQDPKMDSFLSKHFPKGSIPVEIVDHKVIFSGYESYLPVFNSNAIETMIWRIPGLSEHFILFNDDFMLTAPASPEDFFMTDGRLVCYADRHSRKLTAFTRLLKKKKDAIKPFTFKGAMLNAARLTGHGTYYLKMDHTPKALLVSTYRDYYQEHPDSMILNISHRFRDVNDYEAQELLYMLLHKQGRCHLISPSGILFFMQPKNKPDYVPKKLDRLKKGHYRFCCFNSLENAPDGARKDVIRWIEAKLGI